MRGDHQTHLGSGWRQRDGWAIVERPRHPTFPMGAHLIWGTRKCLLDDLQIQETVVTTSGNHPQASGEHVDEWSGIAIQSVQTKEHGSWGKPKLGGIAGNHRNGPQQFAPVISIAWSPNVPKK